MAVGNSGAIVRLVGGPNGRLERVPFFSPVALRRVAWAPSAELALAVGNDGLLLEVFRAGPPASAGFGEGHLRGIAWMPDGRSAVVFANGGILLYERGRGDLVRLHREPRGDLMAGFVEPESGAIWACGFRSRAGAVDRRVGILMRGRADGHFEDAANEVDDVVWTGVARLGDGRLLLAGDAGDTAAHNMLALFGPEGSLAGAVDTGAFHPASIALRPPDQPLAKLTRFHAVIAGSPRSRFFRA
jgi:hypothetical protein